MRRVADGCGNWIEFQAAHALFDPVAIDAAIAAMSDDIKPVLTAVERHTLLVRSNHPSISDRLAYLVEITEQAVAQKLTARGAELEARQGEQLHTFLDVAAGKGYVLGGIDAADLYVSVFPERYAAALLAKEE